MNTPAPVIPGWSVVTDTIGTDGRRAATYRTGPVIGGVAGPKPPGPAGSLAMAPTGWEILVPPAYSPASTRWFVTLRELAAAPAPPPAVTPAAPPSPQPSPGIPTTPDAALAPLARVVVQTDKRAFGLNQFDHTADQLYENQQYENAEQNSAINFAGRATFRNFRGIGSWSDTWNYGQGLYLSGIKGGVTIDGAALAFNGRPEWQPDFTPTGKRHGLYYQADNGPLACGVGIISICNACSGVQTRADAEYELFSFGNSLPILHVMGRLKVRKATIVAPTLHHDGTNWAGGAALTLLHPAVLNDVWIIGMDGMQRPVTDKAGGVYPNAAVNTGGTWSNDGHPVWVPPDPSVPLLTATNCVLAGRWAGGLWGGTRKHDGSGFALAPNNVPAATGPQILALYRQVPSNLLSIADALTRLHALARAACRAANPGAALPS